MSNAIRITAEGQNVKIAMNFSEALQNQLREYSRKMAAAAAAAETDAGAGAANEPAPVGPRKSAVPAAAPTAPAGQ
jgi:hypothetical protein